MKTKCPAVSDQFSERQSVLASFLDAARNRSRSRSRKAAAWLNSSATLAAQRAIVRFIARNGKVQQGLRLHREFDFPAAAVNQCTGSNDSSSSLFDHLNRFERRATRCPNIFYHQNMLIGLQRKSAPQSHRAASIALNEYRWHSPADTSLRLWQ